MYLSFLVLIGWKGLILIAIKWLKARIVVGFSWWQLNEAYWVDYYDKLVNKSHYLVMMELGAGREKLNTAALFNVFA